MTAALATGMLCEDFKHVDSERAGEAANNKLFESWVRRIDIHRLLDTKDLKGPGRPPVRSLLDSSVLEEIAKDAFHFPKDGPAPPTRPYLSDPLHVVLTLTNLRGVPYKMGLQGPHATNYQMRMHADQLHFALTSKEGESLTSFDPRWLKKRDYDQFGWNVLRDAALATGAFPFGLAPRALHRRVLEYEERQKSLPESVKVRGGGRHHTKSEPIPPYWPDAMPDEYEFLCVDGGVIDNEPLELARRILVGGKSHSRRDGRHARRATILVDPFPNVKPFPVDYHDHLTKDSSSFSLFRLGWSLFAGLIDQARFKPEELQLAVKPDIYSRFLIEPVRYDRAGENEMEYAIACGSLYGFGGFLSEGFRRHDYQLGRRNCQQFLRKHFVLPENNPLFDRRSWSPQARETHRVYRSKNGRDVHLLRVEDDDVPHLPIIPLVGDAAREVTAPTWPPEYTVEDLDELRPLLQGRLSGVVKRLLQQTAPERFSGILYRGGLGMLWWLQKDKFQKRILEHIRSDLEARGLLPKEAKGLRRHRAVTDSYPAPFPGGLPDESGRTL